MYTGELRLAALALTELRIRVTSSGLVIEAQGLLKSENRIGPPGEFGFRQSTTWSNDVVESATALVELVEHSIGERLGTGMITSPTPVAGPVLNEETDIASALKASGVDQYSGGENAP